MLTGHKISLKINKNSIRGGGGGSSRRTFQYTTDICIQGDINYMSRYMGHDSVDQPLPS